MDKAYKLLLDPEQKKRALDVIHAGKEYVEHMVSIFHHEYKISNAPPPFHVTQFHYLDFCNAMFLYILKVKEKRKQLKKEGKPLDVEEDDPEMVSSTKVLRLLL